jgi:hypothetical protein
MIADRTRVLQRLREKHYRCEANSASGSDRQTVDTERD